MTHSITLRPGSCIACASASAYVSFSTLSQTRIFRNKQQRVRRHPSRSTPLFKQTGTCCKVLVRKELVRKRARHCAQDSSVVLRRFNACVYDHAFWASRIHRCKSATRSAVHESGATPSYCMLSPRSMPMLVSRPARASRGRSRSPSCRP